MRYLNSETIIYLFLVIAVFIRLIYVFRLSKQRKLKKEISRESFGMMIGILVAIIISLVFKNEIIFFHKAMLGLVIGFCCFREKRPILKK